MTLYNMKRTGDGLTLVKWDSDFNVAAIYNLTPAPGGHACDCPAGPRPTCRHRKMVPIFTKANAIGTPRFYDYETQMWHQPIPTLNEAEAEPSAAKAVEVAGPVVDGNTEQSKPTNSIRRV